MTRLHQVKLGVGTLKILRHKQGIRHYRIRVNRSNCDRLRHQRGIREILMFGQLFLFFLSLQVASRDVFIITGVMYLIFGIIGKISAVFVSIPYPVLGGALIVMFGMFNGVVLSNLQVVSLTSTRNLAIIGTAILFGLMIPYWLETNPDAIQTGSVISFTQD